MTDRQNFLVQALLDRFADKGITPEYLSELMLDALNASDFLASLSEALRVPEQEIKNFLIDQGYGNLVSRAALGAIEPRSYLEQTNKTAELSFAIESPFPEFFQIKAAAPESSRGLGLAPAADLSLAMKAVADSAGQDGFFQMYRSGIIEYHRQFIETQAGRINDYLKNNFPNGWPKYLVTSGIGADEMYCHFMAKINNQNPLRQTTWLVIDSPLGLIDLPQEADADNTIFMEFSRSGQTQETIKTHEFTPRSLKRIVFANQGHLFELGQRDHNLVLALPDKAPGRFGRNTTPILLAPLYVLRQDTEYLWGVIAEAAQAFDPASEQSLPLQLAGFIRAYQQANKINQCYITSSGAAALLGSGDELVQLWNEGVNKEGNDLMICRYFGMPRDSHTVVEGILANAKTKMAIFLMHNPVGLSRPSRLVSEKIDPINPEHSGIKYGEDDFLLAQANYERFKEIMPVIKIELKGRLSYDHGIILGQLWQDLAACYAKILGLDPGSNPEVRAVREQSDEILSRRH